MLLGALSQSVQNWGSVFHCIERTHRKRRHGERESQLSCCPSWAQPSSQPSKTLATWGTHPGRSGQTAVSPAGIRCNQRTAQLIPINLWTHHSPQWFPSAINLRSGIVLSNRSLTQTAIFSSFYCLPNHGLSLWEIQRNLVWTRRLYIGKYKDLRHLLIHMQVCA